MLVFPDLSQMLVLPDLNHIPSVPSIYVSEGIVFFNVRGIHVIVTHPPALLLPVVLV